MSIASVFTPDQPITGNIGAFIQLGNQDNAIPIPNGVDTTILEYQFPLGGWVGTLTIRYVGGADTAITRMTLEMFNEDGGLLTSSDILTNITLPDGGFNYFTYPVAIEPDVYENNEIRFSITADYAGTAINIPVGGVYLRAFKVV